MIKKLLFTLSVIILFGSVAYSQSTIKGSVKNAKGVPNSGVMVVLKSEDRVVNGAYTDDKGEYQIFGVSAGTYDIVAGGSGLCLASQKQSGIPIGGSETKFIDFTLDCSSTVLETVEIVYEAPIFDADNTKSSDVISGADVRKQAGRSISAALANLSGVSSVDGSISAVRGNRPDGQQMIIDGVRVRGGSSVSMQAIEGAELIQGGIPAEYGDGTSFTVITTKGVSREYHGSAEVSGSLDGYNNFLAAVSLSGPIMRSKNETDPARVGFLLVAEGNYSQEGAPARGGLWVANDDLIESLTKNPLRYDQLQLGATYNNAEYLTNDGTNFYRKRVRENVASWGYVVQGKLDFLAGGKDANGKPKNNMKISIGASYQYDKGHSSGGQASALFNSANHPISTASTLRLNARINHRVKTATAGDNPFLKNLIYNININYTLNKGVSEDERHKDNFFNYGHIGKYTTKKAKMYLPVESLTDPDGIVIYDVNVLSSVYDSIITFDPSTSSNPDLAWYTQNFVDNYTPEFFYDLYGSNIPYNYELYQQFGSLLNGSSPSTVYGMFYMPGTVMSGYSKSSTQSIGAKASLSMSLGNHELKLGFEFEKLTYRAWGISPYSLWTLMRAKQNSHMLQLDVNNPIYLSEDTITYNQLVDLNSQTNFDRNLRIALGLDPNGSDWLDIDSYDPSTFDLNMFSADELLVGISGPLVSYYGYDYTGSSINRNKTNISDFFDGVARTDNNGNIIYDDEGNQIVDRRYEIGAYEPVYLAMYIQDKFSIKSMLFNVGLRVDRFDANQQVLSDPFLFREAHTVSSLNGAFGDKIVPNAEGDWVVYVDQKGSTLDPSTQNIIGYRSGTTWYNALGQEVTDPTTMLGANGGPILKEAFDPSNISKVSGKAFEDYKPQWSVMPRISFSFPVSDNSLFYAHYNIITYRPSNLQLDPISYLFIEKFGSSAGNQVSNPNLKPQRSIDYELGFRQKVGNNAAISIAAYYSEKRDQIQSYRYTGAYPSTYYSYDNIDFGTVQGFTLGFNLRAKKFVNLRASYTIQFAKGTGSSAGSNLAIIASGQPNLRTLTNLEFDQRHRITADLSFDFEDDSKVISEWVSKKTGKKKSINWFQNAGASIRFSAASGMPYSRSSVPFSTIAGVGKSQLSGSINGSNKPWIFQCDLRIYKSWILNLAAKPKTEGEKRKMKPGSIMVYLDVMNLFNFKNVLSVYTYTGNPEDDGYLSAAQYQQNINQQVYVPGYIDYYKMVMQSPYNYSLPTRVSLGVQFGF